MKTVILKLTSAIVVAGQVIRPGNLVEVTESEARDLLHRGKAVVATEADAGDAEPAAVTDGDEAPLNPEVEAVSEAVAPKGDAEPAAAPKPKRNGRK